MRVECVAIELEYDRNAITFYKDRPREVRNYSSMFFVSAYDSLYCSL